MSNESLLGTTAYQRLRDDIIEGTLAPRAKLRIADLKSRYNIGASPLREALNRLAVEGLVTAIDGRGFHVPDLSEAELQDIMQARLVIELDCLKLSIEFGDDEWEARVVSSYYQLNKLEKEITQHPQQLFEQWEERNKAFHDALVSGCPSQWLLRIRSLLYDQHLRYRRFAMKRQHVSPDVIEQHEAIKDAALARNQNQAKLAMERHIAGTLATQTKAFQQAALQVQEEFA